MADNKDIKPENQATENDPLKGNKDTEQQGQVASSPPPPKYEIDKFAPMQCQCTTCNQEVRSNVKNEFGTGTYICALLLCCVGCIPGIIPFFVKSCQDAHHTCPTCNNTITKVEYKPCDCDKDKEK